MWFLWPMWPSNGLYDDVRCHPTNQGAVKASSSLDRLAHAGKQETGRVCLQATVWSKHSMGYMLLCACTYGVHTLHNTRTYLRTVHPASTVAGDRAVQSLLTGKIKITDQIVKYDEPQ